MPSTPIEENLRRACLAAVGSCLGLRRGERFLIVSNPGTAQEMIARALADAAGASGAAVELVWQGVKLQGEPMEPQVRRALAGKPEAFASISNEKLGVDPELLASPRSGPDGRMYDHIFHYLMRGTKEMRAFWSPGATPELFSRTVDIDYSLMRRRATWLAGMLDRAAAVRVRAPGGTDIEIGLAGRKALSDDGDFSAPGSGGNLPAGEVFISPELRSAEGRIVFDGSIADIKGDIVISTPISCELKGGYVLSCEGGDEAKRLEAALAKGTEMASTLTAKGMKPEEALRYGTNARHLGELGIGLNTEARISGVMLEDEKVYGTCHFAIGANYDDDAPALIHLDGLVRSPTITLLFPEGQEITVMDSGEIPASL